MRRGSIPGKPKPRCIKPPARGRWKSQTSETGYAASLRHVFTWEFMLKSKLAMTKGGNTMTKSRIRLPVALSLTVLSISFLVLFSFTEAWADCTNACVTGSNACLQWCQANNTTTKSRTKCEDKCDAYWQSGKNPQSMRRGDPTNPPKYIGPGQVKPPTANRKPDPSPPPELRSKRH
jgi:hypothetical protein